MAKFTMKARTSPSATVNGTPKAKQPKVDASDPIAKLIAVRNAVDARVVGRTEVTRAFVLSVVASANMIVIGPPGTAKTYAIQKIASAFASKPGDVFDILLTKFTKPVEVFGPLSLEALEQGRVHYETKGFMPGAKVVLKDEVFKGSSAILNATLRMANERTFQNGADLEVCPIRTIVGMSNEFPEEPALLAAFYDRFPVKLMVKSLEANEFRVMLATVTNNGSPIKMPTLDEADLAEIDRRVNACTIDEDILDAVATLRESLKVKGVIASDRRYVQALRILKAAAVLDGRASVARKDLKVLSMVLWSQPSDTSAIDAIVANLLNPFERQLRSFVDEVYEERRRVLQAGNYDGADKARPNPDNVQAAMESSKALSKVRGIGDRLEAIDELADTDEDWAMLASAKEAVENIRKVILAVAGGKAKLAELADTCKNDF